MISILRTKIDILSDSGDCGCTCTKTDTYTVTVFLKTDKIKVCVLWTYSQ